MIFFMRAFVIISLLVGIGGSTSSLWAEVLVQDKQKEVEEGFPEHLYDKQIRHCAFQPRVKGKKRSKCFITVNDKEYFVRFLYRAYAMKLLRKKNIILEAKFQAKRSNAPAATYLLYPKTDASGQPLSIEESKSQAVNLVLLKK